jgi:hypothetical protein
MPHQAFTTLEQDQLDWMSRLADRLRLEEPRFAQEDCGDDVNEIARTLWERAEWRGLLPEEAAQRWLDERQRR